MDPSELWKKSNKSNLTWCILKRQQRRLSQDEKRTILRYAVCQTSHTRRAVSCKLSGSPTSTYFLTFSPDGETIASSHGDHSVRISNVKSGRCLHVLKGHPRSVWCIAFHHSVPNLLASGCLEGKVNIWDLKLDDQPIASLNCNGVTSLTFHPTDMVLLVATGNQLLLWSWHDQEPLVVAESSALEKIRMAKFDSLGHHILTGIRDTELLHKADPTGTENTSINETSVVHINLQNMETTVGRVTGSVLERPRRVTPSIHDHTHLFRLQWWDFTQLKFPDLLQRNLNVVARNCRLHNNLSADISEDGCLLSALVAKVENNVELFRQVCVFSLEQSNFGQCLFSTNLGCNTISTCFSPLGTHIIVGVACENRLINLLQGHREDRTVAYIFKLTGRAAHSCEVTTLKLQASDERQFSHLKANSVVWHPVIAYGLIAFGTNNGGVYFLHV
jgi:WD40 repeat protein